MAFKSFVRKYRVVLIVLTVVVFLTGVVFVPGLVEKGYMYSVVTGAEGKQLIEDELRSADPNAFTAKGRIKSYRILTDTIEHNPMGGIMVDVEFNNDPDLWVTMLFERDNAARTLEVYEFHYSNKADRLYDDLGAGGEPITYE
ncbi:DUF1310 family protein [Alloscardovia theropitheci]|uniref:DUF1310 family protein n=1 Tax=Alloscardovia theropitheci TaxID=2496842 RepID=A0A4R0QT87_9BIFI|nr:DUF1310 family protein [Alloscardovia theropitheci]TCD54728.1 DUF1310 family protein [Alloscardovia theropitheci]